MNDGAVCDVVPVWWKSFKQTQESNSTLFADGVAIGGKDLTCSTVSFKYFSVTSCDQCLCYSLVPRKAPKLLS